MFYRLVTIYSAPQSHGLQERRDYKLSSVLELGIVLEERGFSMSSLQNRSQLRTHLGALERKRAGQSAGRSGKQGRNQAGPLATSQPAQL